MRPLNRIAPRRLPQDMKTYHITRPVAWWVFATCPQVDCPAYRHGWVSIVPEERAVVVRRSGRSYRERRQPGGLIEFRFPAGQRCFAAPPAEVIGRSIVEILGRLDGDQWRVAAKRWHKAVQDRQPLFSVVDGDWRGNPRGTAPVRFRTARAWVDDFGEHQNRLADTARRG